MTSSNTQTRKAKASPSLLFEFAKKRKSDFFEGETRNNLFTSWDFAHVTTVFSANIHDSSKWKHHSLCREPKKYAYFIE